MSAVVTYQGVRRDGTHAGGGTTEAPAVLVERLFEQGWREVRVRSGDRLVGAVERRLDNGRRTWWAEVPA